MIVEYSASASLVITHDAATICMSELIAPTTCVLNRDVTQLVDQYFIKLLACV